ncbi:hypothetical protein M164_0760 [Sulfolobus islandicus M.16.4]|uniref:Uncharacterized protein n=1 Tax=Saccharolobus islandicus (strain M.16.4 / Kamchatka \|nr:hypothetical protein M164_0760 [Sulfolobus islandicus M.16.4]
MRYFNRFPKINEGYTKLLKVEYDDMTSAYESKGNKDCG